MSKVLKSQIDYSIYLVTDRELMTSITLDEGVEQAIKGGCTLVQLREKSISSKEFYNIAMKIKKITSHYNIPLIINDRVDLAMAVDAEGVHVGQDDLSAKIVRSIIGREKILGVSASNIAEAIKAEKDGADYLGVGAIFSTKTKTDAKQVSIEELMEIKKRVKIPVVAIGGINIDNAHEVLKTGIEGLAMVSAILSAKNIEVSTIELKKLFHKYQKNNIGGNKMSFARSLKVKVKDIWEGCYRHPFLQELGKGTLDKEKFKFYLLQDYLYLLQYSKVFAAGAIKSDEEEYMTKFSEIQYNILYNEMNIHRDYMKSYGITEKEVREVKQSLFNKAYTSNMLATAYTEDSAELISTVFPCVWTYHDYGKRLKEEYSKELENNFYKNWIEGYASKEFGDSFEWFYDYLDKLCENKSDIELKKIEEIFRTSIEFEYLFWDMSYKMKMSY